MGKKLKKATTMQQSAEEGKSYLKRSWGEDKYKRIQNLNNILDDSKSNEAEPEAVSEPVTKKAKLSKHTTMVATANESKEILKDVKIDEDAKTRRQSKQINQLTSKPAKLAKHSTMNATVKESEYVLKDAKIDADAKTRKQSKEISKLTSQKKKTIAKTKNKRSHLTSKKKENAKAKSKK